MTLKYQVEHFDAAKIEAFIAEVLPLGRLHWEEEAKNEIFYPDVVFLSKAWENKSFQVITARDDGALVGYMVVSVYNSIALTAKVGSVVAFFIKKEFRGKGRSKQLFDLGKNIILAMGATKMTASALPNTAYAKWLNAYDFEIDSVSYTYVF